jgi:peroxiredoxin
VGVMLFGMILAWVIVGLCVAAGSWIGFQLIHQNGRMLSRLEALEQRLASLSSLPAVAPVPLPAPSAVAAPAPSMPAGLPVGAAAPAFDLPDLAGGRKALSDFRGRPALLMFFNPGCGFCTQMAADLAALPLDDGEGRPLPLVITTGDAEANRKLVAEYGLRGPVLLQNEMEVAAQYQCNGTPMGYLIDVEGRIASEMAVGGPALLALAGPVAPAHAPQNGGESGPAPLGGKRSLEDSQIPRNGLPVGSEAPEFHLPLLNGGELSLADYRGRKVLLVFSDPHCGPCEQLLPALEAHARQGTGAQVLMISRREVDANRAKVAQYGLTFPMVLQQQWEISREYALFGTPVAYLIDAEGRTMAEGAVGAEAILALLTLPEPSANGKGPRTGKESAARRR